MKAAAGAAATWLDLHAPGLEEAALEVLAEAERLAAQAAEAAAAAAVGERLEGAPATAGATAMATATARGEAELGSARPGAADGG